MTEYMAKIKRYGGGESVIGWRVPRSVAKQLAADWNEQYQTDAAYIELFEEEKFEWPDLTHYI